MLVNTSDVLPRLLLMKHSDLAHILIIHMKDSNSVSGAVSSEHMHLHRHTHFVCTFSTQAEILCAYSGPGTGHFGGSIFALNQLPSLMKSLMQSLKTKHKQITKDNKTVKINCT